VIGPGEPRLGESFVLGVDNPLGTQPPMVAFQWLVLSTQPDPHFPAGTLLPRFGMDGDEGELLVAPGAPALPPLLVGPVWQGVGMPVDFQLDVPGDLALSGTSDYAQGAMLDPSGQSSIRFGLTEAARIVLAP